MSQTDLNTMKPYLQKLLNRTLDIADLHPMLGLFLGAATLAVFLTALLRSAKTDSHPTTTGLLWTLYWQSRKITWALVMAAFVLIALSSLRNYLHQTVAGFQRTHGRVTEANYNAVQTIWGAEQTQGELGMELFYDEEVIERIQSEDITKPAVLRKKTVRHFVTTNPYLSARHEIELKQNARKKGSALYGGYETACSFAWQLKNPADRELKTTLRFPLPAAGAMYDDLSATLDGKDILSQMELKEGSLVLERNLEPNEAFDLKIAFKSRGMSYWYFQVREPREIRDFTLTMKLPDLAESHLNYPEGCMTPTSIKPTADGQGTLLTYRLDHAISNKGMGISLPSLPQPGATTSAVLSQVEMAWLLLFTLLLLGMTLLEINHAVLLSVLFGTATAFGYGLLSNFSDLLLGFWGTALIIVVPMFLLLARLIKRVIKGRQGRLMAGLFLVYGLLLPALAGLDPARSSLYVNLCGLGFLMSITWLLSQHWKNELPIAT